MHTDNAYELLMLLTFALITLVSIPLVTELFASILTRLIIKLRSTRN